MQWESYITNWWGITRNNKYSFYNKTIIKDSWNSLYCKKVAQLLKKNCTILYELIYALGWRNGL